MHDIVYRMRNGQRVLGVTGVNDVSKLPKNILARTLKVENIAGAVGTVFGHVRDGGDTYCTPCEYMHSLGGG